MLNYAGCSDFARHYYRNLGWFLFLELLRCFSSLGSLHYPYVFRTGYCQRQWVSPFGNLRIKAYLPAPRSLSQAITSFIACDRQGIHHVHLVTWSYNTKGYRFLPYRAFQITIPHAEFHVCVPFIIFQVVILANDVLNLRTSNIMQSQPVFSSTYTGSLVESNIPVELLCCASSKLLKNIYSQYHTS